MPTDAWKLGLLDLVDVFYRGIRRADAGAVGEAEVKALRLV